VNGKGELEFTGQTLNKESGSLCPSTAKLDIELEPLSTTYISS
jgi:hypothetical protein